MPKELDYKLMLEDIDLLVNNDFVFGLDLHTMPIRKSFTQKEAMKMLGIILSVYKISHSLTCESCRQQKYVKTNN